MGSSMIRHIYIGVDVRGEPSREYRRFSTAERHAVPGGFVVTKEVWTNDTGMVWSVTKETTDVYPMG